MEASLGLACVCFVAAVVHDVIIPKQGGDNKVGLRVWVRVRCARRDQTQTRGNNKSLATSVGKTRPFPFNEMVQSGLGLRVRVRVRVFRVKG